jgi:hypothetical protein
MVLSDLHHENCFYVKKSITVPKIEVSVEPKTADELNARYRNRSTFRHELFRQRIQAVDALQFDSLQVGLKIKCLQEKTKVNIQKFGRQSDERT